MTSISRNALALRFLLEAAPGIGRIKLAKFAYLADLEARRFLGKPITGFEYLYDQHGPFDAHEFYAALKELEKGGFATQAPIPCGQYHGYEIHPTQHPVEYDFDLAESEVLTYVAQTYLAKNARDLCDDVVYETRPMKNASPGKPLAMSAENGTPGADQSFNLRQMLAGEAEAKAGRTRPLASALDELRARHH